jgi:drug/metabolite transporter (DMT)-like permease
MVAMRFAVASIILLPILKAREPAPRLDLRGALALAGGGLLGVTIYFFFESRGIKLTSASSASLIIGTIPVFTVLAERLFYGTRIRWFRWGGVVLSLVGVYLLVGRAAGAGGGRLGGNLFMLGACLSWVAYNMVSRNLHRRFSDLTVTVYQAFFGTLFLLPLALLERRQWVPINATVVVDILYLAVFCSAAGYFLYVYALARLGPVGISPFINLIPLVGVLGSLVILGESIGVWQVVGGAVAIAGVLVVNLRGKGEATAPSTAEASRRPGPPR